MAISQNFPTTRPSLNLNFARSRKLDSRVTFTRGSTGTYVDESGLIRTAGINDARFDYDPISGESLGLLIEESRTNLLQYSQALATSPWTIFNTGGTSIVNNTITSPNGTTTASTFTIGTAGDSIYQDVSVSGTGTYTFSIFVKAGTSNQINITGFFTWNTIQNIGDCRFNPITGQIVSGTGKVESYPNGWYRVSVTGVGSDSLNNNFRAQIYGDGVGTVYFWGAQLEAGTFPTSYIPTVASTVTRSADNASITGTNFSDFYNPNESSVFWSGRLNATLPSGNFGAMYSIDTGTAVTLRGFYNPFNYFGSYVYVTGGSQSQTTTTPGKLEKMATRYKQNDYALSINGGSIGTFGGDYFPSGLITLNIGSNTGNVVGSQTISQISYYPVALTNTQLQTLTK